MSKLYEILKPEIEEYKKIVKEASTSLSAGWSLLHPDDGPSVYKGDTNQYIKQVKELADMVGYKLLNHMIEEDPDFHYEYRENIVPVVSFGKSDKWKDHILKVGSQAGYEVLRGISKKFGLEHDSIEAGTPEVYQREKQKTKYKQLKNKIKTPKNESRRLSGYYHKLLED